MTWRHTVQTLSFQGPWLIDIFWKYVNDSLKLANWRWKSDLFVHASLSFVMYSQACFSEKAAKRFRVFKDEGEIQLLQI